jgi:hypothetical protein
MGGQKPRFSVVSGLQLSGQLLIDLSTFPDSLLGANRKYDVLVS